MNQKAMIEAARRGHEAAGHVYELALGLTERSRRTAAQTMQRMIAALRNR